MSEEILRTIGWKVAERWEDKQVIWLEPIYVHDIGDRFHHMSMTRTCDFDEYGAPVRGTGPSDARFIVHELLDDIVFYPIGDWLSKWVGDNDIYSFLRTILGFFWGISCGFPLRDVAMYLVWAFRGCHREKLAMQRYIEILETTKLAQTKGKCK